MEIFAKIVEIPESKIQIVLFKEHTENGLHLSQFTKTEDNKIFSTSFKYTTEEELENAFKNYDLLEANAFIQFVEEAKKNKFEQS